MVHFPWYQQHSSCYGRLAQWLERLFYTQDVGGSNPSPPTLDLFQRAPSLQKSPLARLLLSVSKRQVNGLLRLVLSRALASLLFACLFRQSRLVLSLPPVKVQHGKHQQHRTRNKDPKREHLLFSFQYGYQSIWQVFYSKKNSPALYHL